MSTITISEGFAKDIYNALAYFKLGYGDFGILRRFIENRHRYIDIVSSIQNGEGWLERQENEDPAEVLKELRAMYNLIPGNECDDTFFMKELFEFEEGIQRAREIWKEAIKKAGIEVE